MPAVTKGKVLVSGCNGYVAVWVTKQLLEEGYSVRGTIRRENAIPYLKELFGSYGGRFEVVIVPDITKVCFLSASWVDWHLNGCRRMVRLTKPSRA